MTPERPKILQTVMTYAATSALSAITVFLSTLVSTQKDQGKTLLVMNERVENLKTLPDKVAALAERMAAVESRVSQRPRYQARAISKAEPQEIAKARKEYRDEFSVEGPVADNRIRRK